MMLTETKERVQAPPRKRQRQDAHPQLAKSPKEPRLFVPFRALGLVTNHVPFVLQTRSHKGATDGPRIHVLTCLGRSWALWEGSKMTLLFVGKQVSLLRRAYQRLVNKLRRSGCAGAHIMSRDGWGCCVDRCRPPRHKIYQRKGSTLFDNFASSSSVMIGFAYHKPAEKNIVIYDYLWRTNSCLDRGW